MRVQMLRLMANPDHGTVQAGAVVDLPATEARKRIAAGDCKPLEGDAPRGGAPGPDRTPAAPQTTPLTPADTPDVPVEAMTVEQLKAYADEQDIDLGDAKKKDDIRALVAAELERRRDADENSDG
ncbi:hypothetical protein E6R60_05865 [Streptomyces sp. A0642]|uniref:hypothetical protein n=1 Tax=Streptomyces sp. A0642 TaxID=2563100 RepID=UPI0010A28040|nr:hypothetical protein [Streptomyces sp. A0642]THA78409.1 hypothetical protein E6R60_05865 [Streptomyces sp. A0642]